MKSYLGLVLFWCLLSIGLNSCQEKMWKYEYILQIPEHAGNDKLPIMLFLHGAGERGDDLSKVYAHGPPKLASEDPSFPFIVVSPQCPKDEWWDPVPLSNILDEVIDQHRVDTNRIYITCLLYTSPSPRDA